MASLTTLDARVLDHLWAAVIVTDLAGRIVEWSAPAEDLYGWKADEAVGRSVFDVNVDRADADVARAIFASVTAGQPWEGTFRVRRRDGSTFLAAVRALPLRDETGEVVAVAGLSYDVAGPLGGPGLHDRSAFRLERLQALTAALAQALTLEEIADVVVSQGLEVLGAFGGSLCLLGPDRRLRVLAAVGYPDEVARRVAAAPVDAVGLPITEAAATGAPVLVESADELERRFPAAQGLRARAHAVAALPLVVDGRTIGALSVLFDRAHAFTGDDVRFLRALADVCAPALHRATLHADAAAALAAAETTLAQLDALTAAAPVGIALLDAELRYVRVNERLASINGCSVDDHLGRRFDDVSPALGAVLAPILHEVLAGRAVTGLRIDRPGAEDRSFLGNWFPVRGAGGAVSGVGVVLHDVTEQVRTERRVREEARLIETLNVVGRQVAGELDLDRVVQGVTDAATFLTGASVGAFLANPAAGDDHGAPLRALAGLAGDEFEAFLRDGPGAVFATSVRAAEPVRVADVAPGDGTAPVHSVLAVPVVARSGRVLGSLFFGHPEPGAFDERAERLATGIANQAAVAVDNARLYRAEREARERFALLAEAGRLLASSLVIEEVLGGVADLLVSRLADYCVIDVVREDGGIDRIAAAAGGDARAVDLLVRHAPGAETARPTVEALREPGARLVELTPEFVAATWPDDEEYQRFICATMRVAALVTLQGADAPIGVLAVVSGHGRPPLSPADLPLLDDLARRTALALENARLFARERDAAVNLQRALLPDVLPAVPGVELASRYLPGGRGVEVGGDWYDVLHRADGDVGFAIGDVVGRGARAAALMGQLRNALRAYALEGHPPSRSLSLLDRFLQTVAPGNLVTAIKGHLDPRTGHLVWSNAGHIPPLCLHPDGRVEWLVGGSGIPLSTLDDPPFTDGETTLAPGALVVLCTDGLVEERGASIEDGLARLAEAVRDAPHDLEALCDHVIGRLLHDRGANDDVALLVIRRAGG